MIIIIILIIIMMILLIMIIIIGTKSTLLWSQACIVEHKCSTICGDFKSKWDKLYQIRFYKMLVFGERGKLEYPGKYLSELSRKPTNSTQIWRRGRNRTESSLVEGECSHHSAKTAPWKETSQATRTTVRYTWKTDSIFTDCS